MRRIAECRNDLGGSRRGSLCMAFGLGICFGDPRWIFFTRTFHVRSTFVVERFLALRAGCRCGLSTLLFRHGNFVLGSGVARLGRCPNCNYRAVFLELCFSPSCHPRTPEIR